ncbi:MAG: amidohydrolase family protein [Bacilli bacterium]|jgi:imidazolonepropionase-like amidohydrolase
MKDKHYVISNANLVDVINDKIIPNQYVEVNEGKIVGIGEQEKIPAGLPIIDIQNHYLMPGLINLHVHLFGNGVPKNSTAKKGKAQEMILDFAATPLGKKYLRLMAKQGALNQLHSGCTTIRAVGDIYYPDVYTRNQINAVKYIGPRMLVSGFAVTTTHGHGVGSIARGGETKEELVKLINDNLQYHTDLVKICVTGGVMDATKPDEPGDVRMTLEQTKWCADEAHKNHLIIASHTESTKGVEICLKAGVDTIEHGAVLTDSEIEELKKGNSHIITTISPALPSVVLPAPYTHYTPLQIASCKIVSDGIITCAKQCLANGIQVGLGTDSSCPFASQTGMWRELNYFHKYALASNEYALKTATIINASIMHLDDVTGSISIGKSADMIVSSASPYQDLKTLRKLSYVFMKGQVIKNPHVSVNKKLEKNLDSLI